MRALNLSKASVRIFVISTCLAVTYLNVSRPSESFDVATIGPDQFEQTSLDAGMPSTIAPTLPELTALSETIDRPIFVPSRRPAAPNRAQLKESAEMLDPPFTLMGVTFSRDIRVVLARSATDGRTVRLQEGDRFEGWRVSEIQRGSVVVSNGNLRQVVWLVP